MGASVHDRQDSPYLRAGLAREDVRGGGGRRLPDQFGGSCHLRYKLRKCLDNAQLEFQEAACLLEALRPT